MVIFTEEILNGKVYFLCSDLSILLTGMSTISPSSSIISSKSKSSIVLSVLSSLSSTKNRMMKGINATPMSYSKIKIQQTTKQSSVKIQLTAKQSSVKSKVMCVLSRQSKSLSSFKKMSTLATQSFSQIKPDPSITAGYSMLAIQSFSQIKPIPSVTEGYSNAMSVRINFSVMPAKTTQFPNENKSKEKLDLLLKSVFLGIGTLFAVLCVLVIGLYLRQR